VWVLAITGAASVGNLFLAGLSENVVVLSGGLLGLAYAGWRFRGIRLTQRSDEKPCAAETIIPAELPKALDTEAPLDDPNALVDRMFAQGRYALLLRRQLLESLSAEQAARAVEALQKNMAMVPSGEVVLTHPFDAADLGSDHAEEVRATVGKLMRVEPLYLDRYPVTNQQYFRFVEAGGYQQMSLWDPEILPGVLDFVDQTQQPGPRHWIDGCFRRGENNHPVVGISWYEATAFARWVGKRLPTDAEWVKSASWPVRLSDGDPIQRRYPWGEAIDRDKANLWGSGPESIVPVEQFADGMSVGGVYQLVGNVWEWTAGGYQHPSLRDLSANVPWKSLRGGAFDTYFDNQATCDFQSGDHPMARCHNVGFRCALGAVDVATCGAAPSTETSPAGEQVA